MKLCCFIKEGESRLGYRGETGVADLTAAGIKGDMNDLISGGAAALAAVRKFEEKRLLPEIPEEFVEFGKITEPSKIVCIGLNYKDHAAETGGEIPEQPVVFGKFNDALCPAGSPIALPDSQRCYDYEAELVIIMGAVAREVPVEAASEYIFGYACGNDLSARDCQFVSNQWLIGKSFPDFAPAGPYIVTSDSFDPNGKDVICEVNGIPVQTGNTRDMIFNCSELVSYVSRFFRLMPGDLIFTGTPAGVILGKPKGSRVWLKPGDTVCVTVEGIGTLENRLCEPVDIGNGSPV
ncbi:MAG: fumarylacetoacetate hydrolase family protein [Oscillospiraceae bacterium]|nr:fumarylacetoacetate hydrolase family protein [Oscillospiraceae bacterium]